MIKQSIIALLLIATIVRIQTVQAHVIRTNIGIFGDKFPTITSFEPMMIQLPTPPVQLIMKLIKEAKPVTIQRHYNKNKVI